MTQSRVKPTSMQNDARLSHSKQLAKNIQPMILVSFVFTDEKVFAVIIQKYPQNDQVYVYPSTKSKDVVTKRLRTHTIILAFSYG